MGMGVKRFEVYLVSLVPTLGHEMQKTRPCLVISPDEMNRHIATVIIAPMTTRSRDYPTDAFRGISCYRLRKRYRGSCPRRARHGNF